MEILLKQLVTSNGVFEWEYHQFYIYIYIYIYICKLIKGKKTKN